MIHNGLNNDLVFLLRKPIWKNDFRSGKLALSLYFAGHRRSWGRGFVNMVGNGSGCHMSNPPTDHYREID